MRRALVLTSEAARHPFRASLPPHVFRVEPEAETLAPVPAPTAAMEPGRGWRITAQDVRDFLLAYCACFLAVSLYIA